MSHYFAAKPVFDPSDSEYASLIQDQQRWSASFVRAYHASLNYYKMFYNDIHEYGNPQDCSDVLYFIPGFNGTPGQIIFGLPGILRHFGPKLYVKCLFVPQMSCQNPTWIKYSPESMQAKRDQMVADILGLLELGKTVNIVVSSSGFYDFLAAYPGLQKHKDRLKLFWVSCAPDAVSPNRWQKVFYPINGFEFEGCKWFAYPNIQLLKKLNPECGVYYKFKDGEQHNTYYKNELESRFYHKGLMWDYISIDYFNQVLGANLALFRAAGAKLDLETHVLAGIKDGFWDDSSPAKIQEVLDKYIVNYRILYKETSHLWVVAPNHIYDLLQGS